MAKKKILCCIAMLLELARTGGTVSGIPRLRKWSVDIVEFVQTHDPEAINIQQANGKKGLIAISAGLTDAIGRLQTLPDVEIPERLVTGWSKAADAVLYAENVIE